MFASLHPYIGLRVREIARGDLIMEPGRRVNSFVVNFRVQSADTAEGIGVFRRLFFFAGLPANVCNKGKDRVPALPEPSENVTTLVFVFTAASTSSARHSTSTAKTPHPPSL